MPDTNPLVQIKNRLVPNAHNQPVCHSRNNHHYLNDVGEVAQQALMSLMPRYDYDRAQRSPHRQFCVILLLMKTVIIAD